VNYLPGMALKWDPADLSLPSSNGLQVWAIETGPGLFLMSQETTLISLEMSLWGWIGLIPGYDQSLVYNDIYISLNTELGKG
jgi:hypothetical protein